MVFLYPLGRENDPQRFQLRASAALLRKRLSSDAQKNELCLKNWKPMTLPLQNIMVGDSVVYFNQPKFWKYIVWNKIVS